MQIILILFLLNFSQNYYLLSDMKNFDIFIPGGYKFFKFSYPPGGGQKISPHIINVKKLLIR